MRSSRRQATDRPSEKPYRGRATGVFGPTACYTYWPLSDEEVTS